MIRALVTKDYVTFMLNGQQVTVEATDVGFKDVVEAIKDNNEQLLADIAKNRLNVSKAGYIKVFGDNVVLSEDGKVLVDGQEVCGVLSERIRGHHELGLSVEPLVAFLRQVKLNPSARSRLELFDFLEDKNLPLDNDGCFYAYKCVGPDYWSKTAGMTVLTKGVVDDKGRIFNGIGEVIECERSEVDDDRTNECSFGLHAGRLEYATRVFYSPGDKVVIVKINPKDVVSVPKDYNASKLRTCAYTVVEDYTGPLPDFTLNQEEEYNDDDDEYWDNYHEYENEEEYDDYLESDACSGDCSACSVSKYIPKKGDTINFVVKATGEEWKDVVVFGVVNNVFYVGNESGFGGFHISEVEVELV